MPLDEFDWLDIRKRQVLNTAKIQSVYCWTCTTATQTVSSHGQIYIARVILYNMVSYNYKDIHCRCRY